MTRTKQKKPLQKAEKVTSKKAKERKTKANRTTILSRIKNNPCGKKDANIGTTTKKIRWSKARGVKVKPKPLSSGPAVPPKGGEDTGVPLDIVAHRFQRKHGLRRLARLSRKAEGAQKIRVIAEATVLTGSVVIVDDPAPRIAAVGAEDHDGTENHHGIQVIATSSFSNVSLTPPLLSARPCSTRIYVKPLIILDMNGILCHRIRDKYLPDTVYRPGLSVPIAGTRIIPRPSLTTFLDYCFEHFCVAIWTSAKERTARDLVSNLIPEHHQSKLLFVWHQDDCQAKVSKDRDSGAKESVYHKNILRVWEAFPLWNAHNTLLVDDSPGKSTHATRMNVVNPPSLNGRTILRYGIEKTPVVDDQVNVDKQSRFFTALVDLWKTTCTVEHWEYGVDMAVSLRFGGQYNFLRDQRDAGHMSWESGFFLGCEDYNDNNHSERC